MDIDADKEGLFDQVYDSEHIPPIMKVPGIISAKRYVTESLTMVMGGEKTTIVAGGELRHFAVYEAESADVLGSPAWAAAVDAGRWPQEVRPFTRTRRHASKELRD